MAPNIRLSENGTTILAPSARVAELRLEMASAGLPKSGRIGFELFDKTNFGATEFSEHVNYRRALEGELERSVMSLTEVEQARVHLTFPKDSVFLESRQPGKASVVLRLRPGAKLSAQNVAALTNLLASAVEGLTPKPSRCWIRAGICSAAPSVLWIPTTRRRPKPRSNTGRKSKATSSPKSTPRSIPARRGEIPRGRLRRLRFDQRRTE